MKRTRINVSLDGKVIAQSIAKSAIQALQDGKPQLTTIPNVQIIKTGIEYPLASGPTTFTPEDLADAVAAQDDPAIPQPRIWLGHPDDSRIHGDRALGIPSGEPALGKVTDMRLVDEGNTIIGDLTGIPVWLGNIMSSAFPSRSIEGRFNVTTPTGHNWRLIINGLALLGVVWPGVLTIDDIASLYTEKGPKVDVNEATPDKPVVMAAVADRMVAGQVTVEDLRRQWYDANAADEERRFWWLRAIYLAPNELIVDADDGGSLYKQSFVIKGEKIDFGKVKKVKIKYVNASHGGIETEPLNDNRQHAALFASRRESLPKEKDTKSIKIVLGRAMESANTGDYVEIKLGGMG